MECCEYFPKKTCPDCVSHQPDDPVPVSDSPPNRNCRCEDGYTGDCSCPPLPYQTRPPNQKCVKIPFIFLTDESLTPNVPPKPQWVTVGHRLDPPNQVKSGNERPAGTNELCQFDGMIVPKPSETGDIIVQCAAMMGRTKPLNSVVPPFPEHSVMYRGIKHGLEELPRKFMTRPVKGNYSIFPFPSRECFQAPKPKPMPHNNLAEKDANPLKKEVVEEISEECPLKTVPKSPPRTPANPPQPPKKEAPCEDPVTPFWFRRIKNTGRHPAVNSQSASAPPECPPKALYNIRFPRIQPPEEVLMLDPWIGCEVDELAKIGRSYKSFTIKEVYDAHPQVINPFKPPKFSV